MWRGIKMFVYFYPVQMKDSCLSSTLLSDSTVTFGKSDGAPTNNTHTTNHSSPASNPDLIQTEVNPVCTSALKVRNPQFCLALFKQMFLTPWKKHCGNGLTKFTLLSDDEHIFSSSGHHFNLLQPNIRERAAPTHGGCSLLGQSTFCSWELESSRSWPRPVYV